MRAHAISAMMVVVVLPSAAWAEDPVALPTEQPGVTVSLGEPAIAPSIPANPADARLVRVSEWIREQVPACPPDAVLGAAQHFLDDLKSRHPELLERGLGPDFPGRDFESALYGQVAAQLKGPAWSAMREDLARRRIAARLAQQGGAGPAAAADPSALLGKIQGLSPVQHTRLLEGRMDDDDLGALLDRVREPVPAARAAAGAKPASLSAAEIVSEFARRNQDGAAMQRLSAYAVEGRLKTATGEEQHLLLFKMRPNRFRLVVQVGGITRLIIAGDGDRFWEQAPGQPPRMLTPDQMGTRRYLGEFADPLFGGEGYKFERLDDGSADGRKFFRLAVRRNDASGYVSRIDCENYQEIGREESDGSSDRYSDFRRVAGVTMAFREEATDKQGRKGVLDLVRVTPNPGLVQALFEPPAPGDQTYFGIEKLLAQSPAPAGKPKP